ncbi:copper chaperone [Candidatus Bathyarchaeota archaeon]|nr:MAG: copper chaperone [Candidatus Bathyarchaeota archaeon]
MPQQLTFKVIGENTIHCGGCERTVVFTLKRIPGVREVKADHNTQLIEVSLASKEIDQEKLIAELEWIGYHVEPV